jgi:arylsulfatase A-like enzyme
MPARQDLMTGQLNFLRRGWSPLEYDQPDLVASLSRHGVTTMLVTDHYHLWQAGSGNYHQSFHGMELVRGQEMDNWKTSDPAGGVRWPASKEKLHPKWERYARNSAGLDKEEHYFAAQVFDRSVEWLQGYSSDDPFFLMIDCFDPHEPFDPPEGYAEQYAPGYEGDRIIWPSYGNSERYTEEELKYIRALYAGEVTFVDRCFGKLLNELESSGKLEDTMVIVTSDHGFLFGEHQWVGKHSRVLYQDICRTPLLIYHPQLTTGTVYQELVQMPDLTPTILESFGAPVPETVQGLSLLPLWDRAGDPQAPIHSREAIVFGAFGGPVYGTDGEWLIVKKPVPGNYPLYWYTRSHYQLWDFGQKVLPEGSAERLKLWDGQRFPTQYVGAHPGHAAPRLLSAPEDYYANRADPDDELYRIVDQAEQESDLSREETEVSRMLARAISDCLQRLNAPEEQWERLGLSVK